MPELPEVEIHARMLRRWLVGRRVHDCQILDPGLVPEGEEEWEARVRGRQVEGVDRLAKYLLIRVEGGSTLVVHLRMTGKWVRESYVAGPPPRATRLILSLDDGSRARFDDFRRFGRVWLVPTGSAGDLPELKVLGPDALDEPTSAERLWEITRRTDRSIKALLMDQRLIGGLGNICAIEILYRTGIHPQTPASRLSEEQVAALARAIPEFLRWSIETQERRDLIYLGESGAENVFSTYARAGQPCSRCGTPIQRIVVVGRGTYFCPGCQPESSGS